ncbi:MAG: 50S ribosomal protein L21 [Microgenomates group bacterium]
MSNFYAVVKTGGKQYLVKENDEIVVDKINEEKDKKIDLETLLIFDEEGKKIDLGLPLLNKKTAAQIVEHLKGDKINILRFKAKVRYRKRKGFRASLTKIKILKING